MATTFADKSTSTQPLLPAVAGPLAALRQRVAAWFVVEGLGRVLWTTLAMCTASFLLDYFFRLDLSQRSFLLAVIVGVIAVSVVRWLVRPISTPISDDALVLELERAHPEFGESVISAVQFHRIGTHGNADISRSMIDATIRRGTDALAGVNFGDVINSGGWAKNIALLAAALAIVGGLAIASTSIPHIAIWFRRNVMLRREPWPQNTYLEVLRAVDGKIRIPRGDDYTLVAQVKPESKVIPAAVSIEFGDGRSPLPMKPAGEGRFEAVLSNVIQPFDFRLRGGDEHTEPIQVELVEPPAMETLTLEVTYPEYAGGQTETLPPGKGPYFILPGSSLKLTGQGNKPLTQAALVREGERTTLDIKGGKEVSGKLEPKQIATGQYAIELTDDEGLIARRPTTFGLRVRPDREPRVRARLVGIGGMVTARARLPVVGKVTDDYGIAEIFVEHRWRCDGEEKSEGQGKLPLTATQIKPRSLDTTFEDVIELEPLAIPVNSGLAFFVAAADNDNYQEDPKVPTPNIGKAPDFSIRVVTDEELRSDLLRREKEQRQEFERLVKLEEELLSFSRELTAQLDQETEFSKDQQERLAQSPKAQKLIATNCGSVTTRLNSIVVEFVNNRLEEGSKDEDKVELRLRTKVLEPLAKLQKDSFPEAVQRMEQVRRTSGDATARREALDKLIEHQEALVASMRQILKEMTGAEAFQDLVNLMFEMKKLQEEVLNETKKANETRQQGILKGSETSKPEKPSAESSKPDEPKPVPKPEESPKTPGSKGDEAAKPTTLNLIRV